MGLDVWREAVLLDWEVSGVGILLFCVVRGFVQGDPVCCLGSWEGWWWVCELRGGLEGGFW